MPDGRSVGRAPADSVRGEPVRHAAARRTTSSWSTRCGRRTSCRPGWKRSGTRPATPAPSRSDPGRNWRATGPGSTSVSACPIGGRRFTRTYSISSSPERRDGCITMTVKVLDGGRMSRPPRAQPRSRQLPAARPAPGRFPRPRGDAGAPAVHHRRQRHHAGDEHAANLGHRRQHARRRAHPLRPAPLRRHLRRRAGDARRHPPPVPLPTGPHARRARHAAARARTSASASSTSCAPTGASARSGPAVRSRCSPPSRTTSPPQAGRRLPPHRALPRRAGRRPGRRGRRQRHVPDRRNRASRPRPTPPPRCCASPRTPGLNPAHGCRMGICHTCDVPLVAGCVRDLRTGELIDEPGQAVQICISAAAGDCELDADHHLEPRRSSRR